MDEIIKELIKLGEDPDELKFWTDIYPLLEDEEQKELLQNLKKELAKLKELNDSEKTAT